MKKVTDLYHDDSAAAAYFLMVDEMEQMWPELDRRIYKTCHI